jgi:TolB-like protein/Tfp pilus assembly protein PilF
VGDILGKIKGYCKLELLGSFRFLNPNGSRLEISSKKGRALLAMLAVSSGGDRSRTWLQDRLWGSRAQVQAQASLRNMLSSLKALLNQQGAEVLYCDHSRVWLDLNCLDIDARSQSATSNPTGEFLEGLDIAGEEGFEDWLRGERARLYNSPTLKEIPNGEITFAYGEFGDLPALAVLPFLNMTGDPANDLFGEGISEDLIDKLSRLRWLPIIARGSSFALATSTLEPKTIGDEIGARYLLQGRLRDEMGKLVLSASLVDTKSGQIIWSHKQLVDSAAPTVLQELLTGFALALGTKIDLEEQNRVLRTPQADLNVRGLIWRGRWHLNKFTAGDATLAKACFSKALEQEPNSPEALIQMTNALLWDCWALRSHEADIRSVRKMAQKAIIADYEDARGHMIAGITESFLRQPIRAEALLRRAVDLNPSLFLAHGYLGSTLYLNNKPEQALDSLSFAVRLSPNDQHLFHVLGELAISNYMLGQYEAAVDYADGSTLRRPAYWFSYVTKINALLKMGATKDARETYKTLKDASPHFHESFVDWLPFCDQVWNRELKGGLNLVAALND